MTVFGEILRSFREMTRDLGRHKRPLSQARLGELIGHEMEDRGVTGAAVSEWERGKSKVSVEDRNVLIAMIKVLYKCGGIRIPDDADQLLEAGDYRALNRQEIQEVFGKISEDQAVEQPKPEQAISKFFIPSVVNSLLGISEHELKEGFARAEEGPSPSWPRKLALLMRKVSDRISFSPKATLWIGVWWIAWWLTAPSLHWPFVDRTDALQAIGMYVGGTLIVPLLMGMLIDTGQNKYWEAQGMAHSTLLRLYTYQGAAIGFNLGYFFVFPLVLVNYYLGVGPSIWLETIAVTLGLILGNMAARVVPHNLWLAYHRLHLADGAVFFAVAFLGPLWGVFFLEYYSILLTPLLGSIIVLVAVTLFIIIGARQFKRVSTKQTSLKE